MLRESRLDDVNDERLRLVEPYVDNPIFRPQNVISVSQCASKFCAWVLGIVQAATSINEMTLSFVPKLIVVLLALAFFSTYMMTELVSFFEYIFERIVEL